MWYRRERAFLKGGVVSRKTRQPICRLLSYEPSLVPHTALLFDKVGACLICILGTANILSDECSHMKTAYCTYCSKEKWKSGCLLPAIERYDSARIRSIYERSITDNACFLILSGEYALLAADDSIPYYDHLLEREEVGALIDRVVCQLRQYDIDKSHYFTKSWECDPKIRPYHDTIAAACVRLQIPLTICDI